MRAAFQVLVLPYRRHGTHLEYAAFRRADMGIWQFVAGGGEVGETPRQAAIRELAEEAGVKARRIRRLQTTTSIAVCFFRDREHWPQDRHVIPEFCFGADCPDTEIALSGEHDGFVWGSYEEIRALLHWDSNRTALWELQTRLSIAVPAPSV